MEENQSLFDLQVDEPVGSSFKDTARWARLLCILSFIIMAVVLLFLVIGFSALSKVFSGLIPGAEGTAGTAAMGVVIAAVLVVFVVVGVLLYLLFKAALLIKQGTESQNQDLLNDGLRHLSNYFIFYGVLTILGTAFKLLGLFVK